jgi:hypothetical protein
MKKHLPLIAIFLLPLLCLAQKIMRAQGTAQMPFVSILRTEPQQPIEGHMVTVYFRFYNPTNETVTGWIAAEIHSGSSAPGRSPIDWPIKELGGQQSIDGAVMVTATDAGAQKRLRVFFYDTQQDAGNGSIQKSQPKFIIAENDMNIAALVNFRLENFTINHTRARTEDTDYGSLYASVNEQPVMEPISVFMGNFKDGTYPFREEIQNNNNLQNMVTPTSQNLETGPIALVPGINNDLRITYSIYNGGGIYNKNEFLKGYAAATANPELFHGARSGDNKAIEVLKKLIFPLSAIGACDGLVAVNNVTIQSNGIFNNNQISEQIFNDRFNSEAYASQTGCGNTSDYSVRSSILRLSKARSGQPLASLVPIYTNITSGRTIKLNETVPHLGQYTSWQRLDVIDNNGNFVNTNDAAYGYIANNIYHAPGQVTRPLLVIIRGICTMPMYPSNNPLNHLNNGQLSQTTAIVQLMPGVIAANAPVFIPENPPSVKTPETPATAPMMKPPTQAKPVIINRPPSRTKVQ